MYAVIFVAENAVSGSSNERRRPTPAATTMEFLSHDTLKSSLFNNRIKLMREHYLIRVYAQQS